MSDLASVFLGVRGHSAVIVTGPQRSGTTIGARILAAQLDYRYVDEDEFDIHNYTKALSIMAQGMVVLQAPALMHVAHLLGFPVVVMRRSVEEIHKSEERVGWRTAYNGLNLRVELSKYILPFGLSGDIADVKYYCWDTYQKQHCMAFDLDYDALRTHPMFVDDEKRKDFTARQYRVEA